MPFLLRCWLISSIGENPTLVRSRWLKEEAPPAREVQAGLLLMSLTWRGFSLIIRLFYLLRWVTLNGVITQLILWRIRVEEYRSKGNIERLTEKSSGFTVDWFAARRD